MRGKVLVTGGSGFIAGHTILLLLEKGFEVRATVRSEAKASALRTLIADNGGSVSRLEFARADLLDDAGWPEAMAGCDGVFHMASPFPLDIPDDPAQIIRPAVEGTRRVLQAAVAAGVRRAVLTSSLVAISYGRGGRDTLFTEEDWTDPNGRDVSAYVQSKTLAERAAWEIAQEAGPAFSLRVVNPGVVFGPLLAAAHGTSVELIRKMLAGEFPGTARAGFCVVDVRDVADLHVLAYESDLAAGERFVCADKWLWLNEIAASLREQLPEHTRKVPRLQLPSFLVRLFARFDPSVRQVLIELDQVRATDNSKARRLLGWSPRPAEEAIRATAESLLRFGLAGK